MQFLFAQKRAVFLDFSLPQVIRMKKLQISKAQHHTSLGEKELTRWWWRRYFYSCQKKGKQRRQFVSKGNGKCQKTYCEQYISFTRENTEKFSLNPFVVNACTIKRSGQHSFPCGDSIIRINWTRIWMTLNSGGFLKPFSGIGCV